MNSNALVSRQASPSSAPVAMQAQTDALMKRAQMVAACPPDMLPKHYRGNPGACLLAVDWADRNDVSIFEALGEVSFVHGRPVVSAVLQKKLAARSGYTTRILESTGDAATVAVYNTQGGEAGQCTYTLDMAKALGIFKGPVWSADPGHMLVKRATTRALEYFGPSELAPLLVESVDEIEEPDTAPVSPPEPSVETSEVVDAVEVSAPSEAELRAALKAKKITLVNALKTAQEMYPQAGLSTLEAVAANADAALDLADWIDQQ